MKIIKDVGVGTKAGRLTVIGMNKVIYKFGRYKTVVHSVCDCGNHVKDNLGQFGNRRSCGCIEKERVHNKSQTKIYQTWNTIKTRCYTKTSRQYSDYGGRGILMCEGFKNDFLFFERFMGVRPSKSHSIERIDNDGWYCCGECEDCIKNSRRVNVKWATPLEQSYNKRSNKYIEYLGERLCISEAAKKYNIPQPILWQRLMRLKWGVDEAITIPIKRPNKYIHKGRVGSNQYKKI